MKTTTKLAMGLKNPLTRLKPGKKEGVLLLLFCLCLPLSAQHTLIPADVSFRNGVITDYRGDAADIIIPAELNGQPVTEIGRRAFANNLIFTEN